MANRILLTGAGLSANFGAPIASEMSNSIFNNSLIRNSPKLKKLLNENFDYELIYQTVMENDSYSTQEKENLSQAILQAYERLDEGIITGPDVSQTYYGFFKKIVFRFSIPYRGSGYIFTLNQDLLVERKFQSYLDPALTSIELPIVTSKMFVKEWSAKLDQDDYIEIPEGVAFENAKSGFEKRLSKNKIPLSYIKLHGSQEWQTQAKSMMVIGYGKHDQIKGHQLLDYYWKMFEKQINKPKSKILIIGYSFNDTHVNQALMSAKHKNNLEITVINRSPREKIFNRLEQQGYSDLIDQYYSKTLLELFPQENATHEHPDLVELMKSFFEMKTGYS